MTGPAQDLPAKGLMGAEALDSQSCVAERSTVNLEGQSARGWREWAGEDACLSQKNESPMESGPAPRRGWPGLPLVVADARRTDSLLTPRVPSPFVSRVQSC
jgi:hypothetical protein